MVQSATHFITPLACSTLAKLSRKTYKIFLIAYTLIQGVVRSRLHF